MCIGLIIIKKKKKVACKTLFGQFFGLSTWRLDRAEILGEKGKERREGTYVICSHVICSQGEILDVFQPMVFLEHCSMNRTSARDSTSS